MTKLTKNDKLILLYIVSAIALEMAFFLMLGFGLFPHYFWFDLCAILLIAAFIFLAQNFVIQSILFWFFVLIQFILCLTNIIVKKAAGELFSLDMLFLSAEGLQAFEVSFIDFTRSTVIIVILTLIIYTFIKICQRKTITYTYRKRNVSLVIVYFLMFSLIGTSGYVVQKQLISDVSTSADFYVFESDKYLYENLSSKTEAFKKFGTFGFYVKNISNMVNEDELTEDEKWKTVNYLLNGKQVENDYTGVSENNNVMTILLETMEYYAIDPYFTPNLYNIFFESNDTIKLTNFHANNRTNISEGLTLFGNYDKTYPINIASDEVLEVFESDVEFTLPALLKDKGYSTTYYHDYCSWYYNRNITHTSAGFDEVIGLEKMDLLERWVDFDVDNRNPFYEWKNWTLDSEVMTAYFDKMTNSGNGVHTGENFFTHFSLITMHGNHEQREQLQDNYDKLTEDIYINGGHFDNMLDFMQNMNYSLPENKKDIFEHFLWYKAAAMDVDKMVEILLDKLSNTLTYEYDTNGNRLSLLDTTTIVFFADHNCYYNGMANYMRGLEFSTEEYNTELFHIPCTIYDTKLAKKYYDNNGTTNVEKFTSTYNLLPTILDILGMEYNPNFYYGDTIFIDVINVFQSNISGCPYFTDEFLLANNVIAWLGEEVSKEKENTFKQAALDTFYRIESIKSIYEYPEILDMYKRSLYK